MKESSVHVVSIFESHKINGGSSTEYPLQLYFSRVLFTGASIVALSHCVFIWKLLYLNMCPLGLQALHTGQDLLLVAGQTHTHLSQLTDTDV